MADDMGLGALNPLGIASDLGEDLGAIIAEIANAPTREEADRLRLEAMKQFNINLPELQQLEARHIQSAASLARGSDEAKTTRLDALRLLSQRGQEGYNAEDRAAINDTLSEVNQNARGQREALMRQVNPNSGAALALQAGNQQDAAQRAHSQGLQLAAGSRAQALQALAQTGRLAGDIDESEFGQAFRRGSATDAISQFNERNRLDTGRYNNAMLQQGYNNRLGLAETKAQNLRNRATDKDEEAERRKNSARSIGRTVGTVAGLAAMA